MQRSRASPAQESVEAVGQDQPTLTLGVASPLSGEPQKPVVKPWVLGVVVPLLGWRRLIRTLERRLD